MHFQLSDEWKAAMFSALEAGGVVLTLGASDTGKTTFNLALANACAVQGKTCFVVDCDLGQSEIGPPGTIACARVSTPFASFSELQPDGMYFVGSTSPSGHVLSATVGLERMVSMCRMAGPHLILIDMPGFVIGPAAREFLRACVDVAAPGFVVPIQRGDELVPCLSCLNGRERPVILPLRPGAQARRRSAAERSARRALKLASYFAGAGSFELSGSACAVAGTALFSGKPLAANERLYVEKLLGAPLIHTEQAGPWMFLVSSGSVDAAAARQVAAAFQGREVNLVPWDWLNDVIVGLVDANGRHAAVGVLEKVDYQKQKLHIRSPLRHAGIVAGVIAGSLRIRPDGQELGRVRPPQFARPAVQGGHRPG